MYANHKQTELATYYFFLSDNKFSKADEKFLVMVIKLEPSLHFLNRKQHRR